MDSLKPQKFAKILLDQNAHEGTFDVVLLQPDFRELVAQALREMGCKVRVEAGFRLVVSVPRSAQMAESDNGNLLGHLPLHSSLH